MSDRLRAVVYTRRSAGPGRQMADAGDAEVPARIPPVAGHRTGWATASYVALLFGVLAFAVLGFSKHPALRPGILGALLVTAAGVPLLGRLGRGRSFDLVGIALTGLGLKLVGIAARYGVVYDTYDGTTDAAVYHENGARLGRAYRALDFSEPALQKIPGTGFIRVVIGYVYAVTGPRIAFGFLVFGLFGFAGAWLFYRAFETAMPAGDHRRYALLIFLWPSLLFWPSSLGKEAWIILGIGTATFGVARVLSHRRGGFALAALGMWAVTMTRPHVAFLLFVAYSVAYFLRPGAPGSQLGPIPKAFGLAFLFVVSGLFVTQFQDFFGIEGFDRESIESTFSETETNSKQGGSGFEPPDPWNPVGYVLAVVTVIARPFPFEADSIQMLGTSLEGLVLAFALVRVAPRILRAVTRPRQWAYATLAGAYTAGFCFAFASIANFGILARQRTQLLPFVFVLLCLPAAVDRSAVRSGRADAPARPRR